jgi:hypothetical protein
MSIAAQIYKLYVYKSVLPTLLASIKVIFCHLAGSADDWGGSITLVYVEIKAGESGVVQTIQRNTAPRWSDEFLVYV